jgi:hypothetical protein
MPLSLFPMLKAQIGPAPASDATPRHMPDAVIGPLLILTRFPAFVWRRNKQTSLRSEAGAEAGPRHRSALTFTLANGIWLRRGRRPEHRHTKRT